MPAWKKESFGLIHELLKDLGRSNDMMQIIRVKAINSLADYVKKKGKVEVDRPRQCPKKNCRKKG